MKTVMTYVMLFINKLKQKQCSKVQEVRMKEHLLDVFVEVKTCTITYRIK